MISGLLKIYHSYSKRVWGLTCIIFLFICRKTIFDIDKEAGEYITTIDSSTSLAILGIILGFIFIITHYRPAKAAQKTMWPILSYHIFAWASLVWAGSATTITFKSLEHIINIYLIGMAAYYIKEPRKMIYYIILLATISTYLCVLDLILDRGFGWYHTNSYTFSSMIGFLLSVGCVNNKVFSFKEMKWFIFLNFYAWLSGTSSASYIAALIGLAVLFSSGRKGINLSRTLLVSIGLYFLYLVAEDSIYDFIMANHSRNEMETGTGRTILWEIALEKWKTAPLLGHGFIVGETTLGNFGQISSHNSWISTLVNTGIVGATLFSWFTIKWLFKSFKESTKNVYASTTFPVIIAICVNLTACPVLASHWSYVTDTVYAVIAATFMIFVNKNYLIKKKSPPVNRFSRDWHFNV